MNTKPVRALLLLALSWCAFAAIAGPPLVCEPLDTAGAPSLAWDGPRWNQGRADYDLRTLSANTEALLTAKTPVIARMETMRRAAIYASRDADVAIDLLSRLNARAGTARTSEAQAFARFDAGYFAETLQDVIRARRYGMPGVGDLDDRRLQAMIRQAGGAAQVEAAIRLRPQDASMRFAAAMIAISDQHRARYDAHTRVARAGLRQDSLLVRNFGKIASYREEVQ